MRIARRSDHKMVIRASRSRIKRVAFYGAFLVTAFIAPSLVFAFKDGLNLSNISDLLFKLVYPAVALISTITILFREGSRVVIDKKKGRLSVSRPFHAESAGTFPLATVSEVCLRHHGNPYYFPKLSIVLCNGEEIPLSSDVHISTPCTPAPPLYGHVMSERALGTDIARFIGVPFREVRGGEIWCGLDQAEREVSRVAGTITCPDERGVEEIPAPPVSSYRS